MKRIELRRADAPASAELVTPHPVLTRVLRQRGVASWEEVDARLGGLLPYAGLLGLTAAVDLLQAALQRQARILIVGDYDSDGATSTALVVRALRAMGMAQVDYLVPNRFEYGYGLSPEIVSVALARQPEVIITVDNGIASHAGVELARAHGVEVLITDHHLPAATLPAASAIVNPNQPGDGFPSKAMAGVGVAFYLMLALRKRLRESGWFDSQGCAEPNLGELLDLVALGTVADVVGLDRNNRILVAQGLARVRQGRGCPGITALCQVAGRDPAHLVAADLGFALAPRLNAAGRMEDMALGIACLLSDDADEALALAQRLDGLNLERRAVEAQMQEEAWQALARLRLDEGELPYSLCLYDEGWHQGVIGILASRVKDRVHRPVLAFAAAGAGEVKGSARSIPGFHIRDALDAVATRHPGLITRFGGHAMAAGLSLELARLDQFRSAFEAVAREWLAPSDLQAVLYSDGELSEADLTLELAQLLANTTPWGQGFPEPSFDGEFEVVQRRIVGERHLKMQLRPRASSHTCEAIAFNTTDAEWPAGTQHLRLLYRLAVNRYGGRETLQLLVDQVEPLRY